MPAENWVEVTVGDYGTVLVEITPTTREGWREAGRSGELVQKMTMDFERVMESVRTIAHGFRDGLERLEKKTRPDEATLEFGLSRRRGRCPPSQGLWRGGFHGLPGLEERDLKPPPNEAPGCSTKGRGGWPALFPSLP